VAVISVKAKEDMLVGNLFATMVTSAAIRLGRFSKASDGIAGIV
jgi:hypothetical protein